MKKKCKPVLLVTDEGDFTFTTGRLFHGLGRGHKDHFTQDRHLYIISDDEIKEGNWFVGTVNGVYGVFQQLTSGGFLVKNYPTDKKIIATTNTSLGISMEGESTIDKMKDYSDYIHYNKHSHMLPQIPDTYIQLFIEQYNAGDVKDIEVEYECGYQQKVLSTGEITPSYLCKNKSGFSKYKKDYSENHLFKEFYHWVYDMGYSTRSFYNRYFEDLYIERPKLNNEYIIIHPVEPIIYTEEEVELLILKAIRATLKSVNDYNTNKGELIDQYKWFEENKKK